MFKFNPQNNSYVDFLEYLNPTKIDFSSKTVTLSLNDQGNVIEFPNQTLHIELSGGGVSFVRPQVSALAKLEMAFHALNSKVIEEFPYLDGENFKEVLTKLESLSDENNLIYNIYALMRIIRNKFQHNKTGGIYWDRNNLIVKDDNDVSVLKISLEGIESIVYFVWFILKNNMNLKYNIIISNMLYYRVKTSISLIDYKELNRSGKITYIFDELKDTTYPWRKHTYSQRVKVETLKPRKVSNGYILKRIKCFLPYTNEDKEKAKKYRRTHYLYRSCDYHFEMDNSEYLIPDEFFYRKKDGKDVFISESDLASFKYLPKEMAIF